MKKLITSVFAVVFTLALSVSPALAAHNGAVIDVNTGACGETTFTASIADPSAGHVVSNMYLTVHVDGQSQNVNVPVNGSEAQITVGPFTSDQTISWNVFGGGERAYDQPLWNGYGQPGFSAAINAYAAEQGTFSWVLDGPDNPNPFTNFFEVDVEGCSPPMPVSKNDCKKGGWESLFDSNGNPFKNQGQCVAFVASGGKNIK